MERCLSVELECWDSRLELAASRDRVASSDTRTTPHGLLACAVYGNTILHLC